MTSSGADAAAVSGTRATHGDHVDTIESVDYVFRAQRKLSFTYGAIFFAVTLAVPALSVWVEGWYTKTIWGGFTWNYLFISLLYYVFLWVMAWTYSQKADKLDDTLADMADKIAANS
ncbi:MAG: DUF485 domain-containing protein [Actinomycetota bacterium]|nr:DUF485 domain-containing protein [Actinomycetota bacterium]